jgi:tRNA A37 threonylcarbamoyladenosine dehydratase
MNHDDTLPGMTGFCEIATAETEATSDVDRRFSGVARLYGLQGFARIRATHAVIVGIGGVGSSP